MVQNLHPLWLNWWKVSSPYTARDGSVTHFGAISEYMYCIVDGKLALKTNNPYLYHVMSPIKSGGNKKWFQRLPLQGCLASNN